jgi:cytochrome c553
MKRAIAVAALGVSGALAALAQSPDFTRKPPAWQVALDASKDSAAGKAIAANGKGAATACAGCHGASGVPAPGAPFPRLAGLPVEYVAKQLFDYRDGSRPNAIMAPIAKALSDSDIASLAW